MNFPCNWKGHFSDSPVLTTQPQMNAVTSQVSIYFISNGYFREEKIYIPVMDEGDIVCNKLQ